EEPAGGGRDGRGEPIRLHLSTEQPGGFWVVEPRHPAGAGSDRYEGRRPTRLALPGGGRAGLLAPSPARTSVPPLWLARLDARGGGRQRRLRGAAADPAGAARWRPGRAARPLPRRGLRPPAVAGPPGRARRAARPPGGPRPAHPLPPHRRRLAARRLPVGVLPG